MNVEHLIIGGGGPIFGLYAYGILNKMNQLGQFNISNIKTIYGCSAGAILGGLLCLNYDWNDLSEYIIGKPWDKIVDITPEDLLNISQDKGILDRRFFEEIFNTLLLAKDLSIDITLKELYEYSHIDLHVFTVKINNFEYIDMSHVDYPEMKVIDAIYMSSAIPFIFKPVIYNNCHYIDGGLIRNFPFDEFKTTHMDVAEDNILCISLLYMQSDIICEDMNLLTYASFIYRNQLMVLDKQKYKTKYKIDIPLYYADLYSNFLTIFQQPEMRNEIINEKSHNIFNTFMNYHGMDIDRVDDVSDIKLDIDQPP